MSRRPSNAPTLQVRYYGHYSNKSRGMRKKAETNDTIAVLHFFGESQARFRFFLSGGVSALNRRSSFGARLGTLQQ